MTLISWTDTTDNIIAVEGGGWWCRRISASCNNCYAAALNQNSFFGGNKLDYSGEPPHLVLKEQLINSWARQTKPKKHFVASMTDIFGEWVPREWQFKMLDGMWNAPKQTFQLLTKRPSAMKGACNEWMQQWTLPQMPKNIWLGTTIENSITAKVRIPILQSIPASVRFLSCEPLLEDLSNLDLDYIHWVIVGGESGKHARHCHIDWINNIVHQCKESVVPIFVKQLGYRIVDGGQRRYTDEACPSELIVTKDGDDGTAYFYPISDRSGSKMEDFPLELQIREFPKLEEPMILKDSDRS